MALSYRQANDGYAESGDPAPVRQRPQFRHKRISGPFFTTQRLALLGRLGYIVRNALWRRSLACLLLLVASLGDFRLAGVTSKRASKKEMFAFHFSSERG